MCSGKLAFVYLTKGHKAVYGIAPRLYVASAAMEYAAFQDVSLENLKEGLAINFINDMGRLCREIRRSSSRSV